MVLLKYKAKFISLLFSAFLLSGCGATSMNTQPASLGEGESMSRMLELSAQPGPITFKKHLAANWEVNLSGLLNLDHPEAIKAGLTDRPEPIELYVYTLTHPMHGTFIVDSGISERFRNPAENEDLSFLIKAAMGTDKLKVVKTTQMIHNETEGGIKGVFLTHIHLDHIMGLSDLPMGTPVYIGPGDAAMSGFQNLFTQGTTNRLLANAGNLKEWQYKTGIIDIFGDGSVWAIHAPGHSPGSTSYLVRTTNGPHLLTGDASHTAWGWQHNVEPGTFSENLPQSADSLKKLKFIVQQVPQIKVHPGHQSLPQENSPALTQVE